MLGVLDHLVDTCTSFTNDLWICLVVLSFLNMQERCDEIIHLLVSLLLSLYLIPLRLLTAFC